MNKVLLVGNLGADVDLRRTNNGTPVATLSVATTEKWVKSDGTKQEDTQWHRVVLFGASAENAAKFLGKGSKIAAEGRIQHRKWEDKNGVERWTTEVICSNIEFISSPAQKQTDSYSPNGSSGDVPF